MALPFLPVDEIVPMFRHLQQQATTNSKDLWNTFPTHGLKEVLGHHLVGVVSSEESAQTMTLKDGIMHLTVVLLGRVNFHFI